MEADLECNIKCLGWNSTV